MACPRWKTTRFGSLQNACARTFSRAAAIKLPAISEEHSRGPSRQRRRVQARAGNGRAREPAHDQAFMTAPRSGLPEMRWRGLDCEHVNGLAPPFARCPLAAAAASTSSPNRRNEATCPLEVIVDEVGNIHYQIGGGSRFTRMF
jgi:hypothetical protein